MGMSPRPPQFAASVPLHHQIHAMLRDDIMDGLYVGAAGFPGEQEVADRFGVSLITSRTVLKRLAEEGLVKRGRGQKSHVVFAPQSARHPLPDQVEDFSYRVLSVEEAIAPLHACDIFGAPPGSVMWQCLRLRLVDGRPHSVTHSVEPLEIGRLHDPATIGVVPVPILLSRAGYPVTRVSHLIGVGRPSATACEPLGVTAWDTILKITLIHYSEDRPVEWTRVFYHPEQELALETVLRDAG